MHARLVAPIFSLAFALASCGSPAPPPNVPAPTASPSTSAAPAPSASTEPVPSTHAVVVLMIYSNVTEPGSLHVERALDRIQGLADDCRAKHAIVAGASARLEFERKGALMSTIVGVSVVESSKLSDEAKACLHDAIVGDEIRAEAGTFTGARITFE